MGSPVRDALEDMVWQFAERTTKGDRRYLSSGGLSALENAFDALGWNDPLLVKDGGCEWPDGCRDWATTGTPMQGGYRRLCGKHYAQVQPPTAAAGGGR